MQLRGEKFLKLLKFTRRALLPPRAKCVNYDITRHMFVRWLVSQGAIATSDEVRSHMADIAWLPRISVYVAFRDIATMTSQFVRFLATADTC